MATRSALLVLPVGVCWRSRVGCECELGQPDTSNLKSAEGTSATVGLVERKGWYDGRELAEEVTIGEASTHYGQLAGG